MKRLLGTVIAVALLVSPGLGSAEILKNLKVGGNLDLQAISARNVTDFSSYKNDRIGVMNTRLLLNADWDLLDDVHAGITLRKNDRSWGNNGTGAVQPGDAQSQSITAGPGNDVLANVYVQQAKVKVDKVFGVVDTSFGRQYFGEKGDLVMYFGPTDAFGLPVTSVDSFVANYSNDMVDVTGMAGKAKAAAFNVAAGANNDIDVHGTEAWFKGLPLKTGAFVWRRVTHNAVAAGPETPNDVLWVYGLKLRGDAAGAWFQADAAFNGGEFRQNPQVAGTQYNSGNYVGKAFLAKAGYKAEVPNVGGFTPWVNFGWGSGGSDTTGAVNGRSSPVTNDAFTSIASDYRPGIINRRFSGAAVYTLGGAGVTSVGTNGLTNRVLYGLGVNMTPAAAEKLTVGAELWDYRFQRIDANGGAAVVGPNASPGNGSFGNKHIGYEWGLTATWKHSENVLFDAGYAGFQPGGYIYNVAYNNTPAGQAVQVSPVRVLFGDIGIKF